MSSTINAAQRIQQLQVEIQGLKNEAKKAQVKALKDKNWAYHTSLIEKISKRNNEIATLKKGSPLSQPNTSKKQDTSAVTQGLTREQIKAKIVEANTKAKNADSKMRTALKNKNQQQIKTYQQKRDAYNTEVKRLQQLLNNPTTEKQISSPSSTNQNAQQAEKRKQIKAQIAKASKEAKAADANMRTALRNKQPDHATSYRKERDSHNAEVKRLQQLLKSTTAESQTVSGQPIESLSASELEKYKKSPEARKKRLNQLPFEIKHAKKMTDLYIKNKSDKRYEWSRKLKKLQDEKQLLQKPSTLDTKTKQEATGSSSTTSDKEQIKAQMIKDGENIVSGSDFFSIQQASVSGKTNKTEQQIIKEIAILKKQAITAQKNAQQEKNKDKQKAYWTENKRHMKDIKRLNAELARLKKKQGKSAANKTLKPLNAQELKRYEQLKRSMDYWKKTAGQKRNIKKYQAEFNELKKRFSQTKQGKNPVSQIKSQGNTSDISKIVAIYAKDPRQDTAQMRIIKLLLDTKYPTDNSKINPYDRVRGSLGETLAPLFLFRGDKLYLYKNRGSMSEDPNKVNTRTITTDEKKLFSKIDLSDKIIAYSHFIRDFMQIQGPFTKPIVIDGILINDFMAISEEKYKGSFVKEFNIYADKVNKHPLVKDIHPPVEHFHKMAHRDGFQLIPSNKPEHFAGEILENVTIQNTVIYSEGDLQGIFATDGAFKNICILNNHIQTKGKYHISISGMLTGCTISGNKDMLDNPLHASKITLFPLRIGGGANILIVGFDNTGISNTHPHYYHYADVKGVYDYRRCGRASDRQGALDPKKPSAYFYTDVHMATFWIHYKRDKINGGNAHQMKALMSKLEKIGKAKRINKKADLDKLAKKFKQT